MALLIEFEGKGGLRSIDICRNATEPFGFLYQDRVQTPLGEASVVGVHDNKLWFHVDGDHGASFWSNCVTAEDFARRGFVKVESDATSGDPNTYHKLKRISFRGHEVSLVMQNVNGPCPIIAVANALILRGELPAVADQTSPVIKSSQLREHILAFIKAHRGYAAAPHALRRFGERVTLAGETDDAQKLEEARAAMSPQHLQRFYNGIDVSPIFTNVDGFDLSPDAMTFALANCRLLHGWIIAPDDATFGALREHSYDELALHLVGDASETSARAREFLETTSSQLTEIGLWSLHEAVDDGEIVVLFRNNHFCTLLKSNGMLLMVVSDEGYADRTCIAFEALTLRGGGAFFDGDLHEVEDYVLAVVAQSGTKFSDDEIRVAFAALVSEMPHESAHEVPTVAAVIERLEKDARGKRAGTSTPPPAAGRGSTAAAPLPVASVTTSDDIAAAVRQLTGMGFSEIASVSAMQLCGSVEQAIGILTDGH